MSPSLTEKKDAELCRQICERCAEACELLATDEAKLHAPRYTPLGILCADAVDACRITAHSLERGSPQHPLFCALCAQVCRLCAEACETRIDDELGKNARDGCVACAEECARHAVEKVG